MKPVGATLRALPSLLPWPAPALPARWRGRLAAALAAALLLGAGYQLWLRDSGLVRVEHVTVSGLSSSDAPRIRAALGAAAKRMTTLHLDAGALERAVGAYPVVRSVELRPDFPHGLRIEVTEQLPTAFVRLGGRRVLVAADGTLLRGVAAPRPLPVLLADAGPRGRRLTASPALGLLGAVAAAPLALARRIVYARESRRTGIVVRLRRGPYLILGDSASLGAKWTAAASVLADPASRGATYLDLRVPGRAAAGGVAPSGAADAAAAAQAASSGAPAGAAPDQSTAPGAPAAAPQVSSEG
jgi:cell division protein FtsQ